MTMRNPVSVRLGDMLAADREDTAEGAEVRQAMRDYISGQEAMPQDSIDIAVTGTSAHGYKLFETDGGFVRELPDIKAILIEPTVQGVMYLMYNEAGEMVEALHTAKLLTVEAIDDDAAVEELQQPLAPTFDDGCLYTIHLLHSCIRELQGYGDVTDVLEAISDRLAVLQCNYTPSGIFDPVTGKVLQEGEELGPEATGDASFDPDELE